MAKPVDPPADRMKGTVTCDDCGKQHAAEFDHHSPYDQTVLMYAVVCDVDGLTGYYQESRVAF